MQKGVLQVGKGTRKTRAQKAAGLALQAQRDAAIRAQARRDDLLQRGAWAEEAAQLLRQARELVSAEINAAVARVAPQVRELEDRASELNRKARP